MQHWFWANNRLAFIVYYKPMPIIVEAASLFAAPVHPGHKVGYAPEAPQAYRCDATPIS